MKIRLGSVYILALLLLPLQALAGISSLGNPQLIVTSPTTPANLITLTGCQDFSQIIDTNAGVEYILQNCAGTYQLQQLWPPVASTIQGLNTAAVPESGSNLYFTNARATSAIASVYFIGTTSQYVRGDGTLATFPSSGSWAFNHPSRALNSCFQVSSTQDTNFVYSIDISATLTLGGGTGTVTAYTNSGCSTGAQVIANGAVSSVALGGTSSIPLVGWLPGGQWAKITGAASGGGTAAVDAVQTEAIKP